MHPKNILRGLVAIALLGSALVLSARGKPQRLLLRPTTLQ